MYLFAELKSQPNSNQERKRKLVQDVINNSNNADNKLFLERFPRHVVIAFVEAIENQHHYLDFIEYLRSCVFIQHNSCPDDIYDILCQREGLESVFNKVEEDDLRESVQMHISRVKADSEACLIEEYADYLNSCDFITPDSRLSDDMKEIERHGKFQDLSFNKKEQVLESAERKYPKYYPGAHLIDREKREGAPSNPVTNMLFRARKRNYSVDLNPEVELEKIRRSNAMFYSNYLDRWAPQMIYSSVPSMRVRVMNLPFGASPQVVKKFFSRCRDIKCVKMTRGDRLNKTHTAYVTFTNVEGANKAILLMGEEIDGKPVDVTLMPDSLLATSSPPVPKHVVASKAIVDAVDEAGEGAGSILSKDEINITRFM